MGRVWVIGSLNVDRPWRVDRHPQVGETIFGSMGPPQPGGKGLNQAVAARRMGAEVSLVGYVGNDDDGRWLTGLAADEGIDVSRLTTCTTQPTGSALIVVADDGANTVTVASGANAHLAVQRLPLEAGDVVMAQLEVPVAVVADAFAQGVAAGATTVFNPSPVALGRALVEAARVVVLNEVEAAELAAAASPSTADDALELADAIAGPLQTVIVTRGGEGAVLVSPHGAHVFDAQPVTPVDTTGAGDCFSGVLAASLAAGVDLVAAVDRANRAAALSATVAGTVAAMPTAVEVDGGGGPTSS